MVTATATATATAASVLLGKRVLITGASGGIGKGLALELGINHGCEVLVHYNQRAEGAAETQRQIQESGGICAGIVQADFRDSRQIHQLFDEVDSIWPTGLDILINNAGIVAKIALEDDDEQTLAAWHECFAVNLHAPRLLSHLAVPRMKFRLQQQGESNNDEVGCVILNVSSIHSEKSNEYMAAYAASKAALDSLTRSQAIEYAELGIRVNAIAPGVVPVERTAKALAEGTQEAKLWKERIPLKKLGRTQDIAQASIPLLSNPWITGKIWQVDGGMMARSNMPERQRPKNNK